MVKYIQTTSSPIVSQYNRKIRKKISILFLVIYFAIAQLFPLFAPFVYAASTPWSQTNWVGGSGQTSWSDTTRFSTSSNITDTSAGQLTLSPTSGWCNNSYCTSSWKYRKKITFDNTTASLGVTSENLVNFPVQVKLTSSNIDYSKTQDSGQDIRFTDTDGSDLAYEIERWDETGTSTVWVKVPQIDINSNTDYVYLYYGNSSATDHQQASSVWDSNFKGVWHMNDNASNTTVAKSTTSGVNAAEQRNTNLLSTSGKVDLGLNHNGTTDYALANHSDLDLSNNFTLETWFKPSNLASDNIGHGVISWGQEATGQRRSLLLWNAATPVGSAAYIYFSGYGAAANLSSGIRIAADTWYHAVITVNSSNRVIIYVNGVNAAEADKTLNSYSYVGTNFGKTNTTSEVFNGVIDEVRISNTVRTAGWVAASYKSESDLFNTFNSEEERYSSTGTLTSSIFDTEQQSDWGSLTYTTDGIATTTVKIRTSNSSSMTGATDFSSCTAISSSTDISSNSCVTDSHRYIQYQITLTSVSANTPTFQDLTIPFSTSDLTSPSISLNTLSPDPNNDSTPTFTGTVTDTGGSVNNVQYQVDGTSGTWVSCTASDGNFDSASESFVCTLSSLSDGSHTIYIRATDTSDNISSNATDDFTIDTTTPISFDLDSPSDGVYTNTERPSFKWKTSTDATSGLSAYSIEVSDTHTNDFTIDGIPTFQTSDYETSRFKAQFENFADSDSTNNYITVYTKSSSDWGDQNNDGKLKEGKRSWRVKATDKAGNERSYSRSILVDKTAPITKITQINDESFASNNFNTSDKTPTIYGKIIDPIAGDKTDNKVSAGPKNVEIKIERKNGLNLYSLLTLATINLDELYWTVDDTKITDNLQNKSDKYSTFRFTPQNELPLGNYRVTISGKDKLDNTNSPTSFYLNIVSYEEVVTPEVSTPRENTGETPVLDHREEITKSIESVKPTKLESTVDSLTSFKDSLYKSTKGIVLYIGSGTNNIAQQVLANISKGTNILASTMGVITNTTNQIATKTSKSIQLYTNQGIKNTVDTTSQSLSFVQDKLTKNANIIINETNTIATNLVFKVDEITSLVSQNYIQLTSRTEGTTKIVLSGIGSGISTTGSTLSKTTLTIFTTANNITQGTITGVAATTNKSIKSVSMIGQSVASWTANTSQKTINTTKNGLANTAFNLGEKTQDVSDTLGHSIVQIGYLFVNEPTKIYDVKVEDLTPTSAKISWMTNHPANGKVNYGLDETYPFDVQSEKRVTHHEFVITELKPDTEYHFEVMSHNKNYVYDANRKFRTPAR